MTEKLRTPIRSKLIPTKVKNLMRRLRERITTSQDDQDTLLSRAFAEAKKFFSNLRGKVSEPLVLTQDKPRSSEEYNEHMQDLRDDLDTIYADGREIANSLTATLNYTLTNQRNLMSRVERLTGLSIDLKLANDVPDDHIFVAGDDFIDDSRVDNNFPVPGIRTAPRPLQGAVTLAPRAANNLAIGARIKRVEGPARTGTSSGLYEGKFFHWLGEAIPEGGQGFRWIRFVKIPAANGVASQKHAALVRKWNDFVRAQFGIDTEDATTSGQFSTGQTDLRALLEELRSDPAFQTGAKTFGTGFGFTLSELELIAGSYQDEIGSDYYVLPYETFWDDQRVLKDGRLPEGGTVIFRAARLPLSIMEPWRARAIDGNPDTTLRFENTLEVAQGFGLAPKWPPEDWTAFERVLRSMLGSEQILEQLQKYANPGDDNLQVRFTLELPEIMAINWINLIPFVEAASAWLRVENIEFATEDSDELFEQLPGLHANKYDNVLTDEANREISEDEAFATLSPDRGQYTGQGIWIFPTREVKFIRFTLRQDVLTPAPYEVINFKLQNIVKITKKTQKKFLGFNTGSKTEKSTRVFEQIVNLDYEPSLIITHAEASELGKEIAGETEGGSDFTDVDTLALGFGVGDISGFLGGIGGGIGAAIGDIIEGVLGFVFGKKVTVSTTSTGWQIAERWKEARFDRARYVIGLRDIGVFSYIYEEQSAFVSRLFRVPRPINKVALFVDEFVPQELLDEDAEAPWLTYEVSFNDANWFRIAPASNIVTLNQDGEPIPQIININSDLPQRVRNPRESFVDLANEVTQVRIRVTMRRPEDLETFSPVLKRYRLRLALKGGLF